MFRLATTDDIASLHRLIERAYRGESAKQGWTHEADLLGGQRTDEQALQEIVDDPAQVILLALAKHKPAGCVQLTRLENSLAYLGLLTVVPKLQADGLGKQIMVESERYVQEKWQCTAMEMTVIKQREELIAYYERRGYQRTGENRPFPIHDPKFGLPKTDALEFTVLKKLF